MFHTWWLRRRQCSGGTWQMRAVYYRYILDVYVRLNTVYLESTRIKFGVVVPGG